MRAAPIRAFPTGITPNGTLLRRRAPADATGPVAAAANRGQPDKKDGTTMQEADVAAMLRDSMMVVLKLGGPVLGVALATGLLISLVQAATQINEQTLAFVPKVLAIGATLLLTGSFMMATLSDFAHLIFDRIVAVGGS